MINIQNLKKSFETEEVETLALNNVNLEVEEGEFVAIMGAFWLRKINLA